jgi:hypothetical protein
MVEARGRRNRLHTATRTAAATGGGMTLAPLDADITNGALRHAAAGGSMAGKQMEGNNEQRRAAARKARKAGASPSEVGATLGSSQQRSEAEGGMTHQEKIDLKREGKQKVIRENTPEARPGSRDADTLDRQRHPRLPGSDTE